MKTSASKFICGIILALAGIVSAADPDQIALPVVSVEENSSFEESDLNTLVPIALDVLPKAAVVFRYCFDVTHDEADPMRDPSPTPRNAVLADFKKTSVSKFPVCDDGQYESVTIPVGSLEPANKIYINVVNDAYDEGDEILTLKIFDLSGAVLPEEILYGEFKLTISEKRSPRFDNDDKNPYMQNENPKNGVPANKIVNDGDIIKFIDLKNVPWEKRDSVLVEMPDMSLASGMISATDLFEIVIDSNKTSQEVKAVIKVKDASKLDYEGKLASSYDVVLKLIQIKDDGSQAVVDTIIRHINLVDVNEAPVIAGKDTTITIPENLANGTVAGKIPASDPDIKHVKEFGHLEYSILTPNVPFKMDSNKIVVSDAVRLDYEALMPDTSFSFRVQVANCALDTASGKYMGDCLYDTAMVSLAVTDVPEKTIIVPCEGGSCSSCSGDDCADAMDSICVGSNCQGVNPYDSVLTLAVKENVPTGYVVMNYAVFDEDVGIGHRDTLVASFKNTYSSGADSLFKAEMKKVNGEWRLIVSVKDDSKLDYERVRESHAVTVYVTDPEDPAGMRDSLRRIIKVVDVNEAPRARDADLKLEENHPKGAVIGKLDVVDPDTKNVKEFAHLEYSIIGKDSTYAFVMDSNIVIVNDPSKMDYELTVHKYVFYVVISNCELNTNTGKYDGTCLYDTARVTVDIQNINEIPKIIVDGPIPDGYDDSDSLCIAHCDTTNRGVSTSNILTIGVKENPENPNGTTKIVSPTDMILFQYHVVDEDSSHVAGAKVSWFDAATTIPSVSTKGSDLFNIEYKNGVITGSIKDQKLLDYEKLRNASSRNDPDPEYTMGIVVTDPYGLADTLYRAIRIIDMNEKPLFEVWPIVISENNHIGDSLGHVEHPSDIDSLSRNPALYDNGFKMTGGDTGLIKLVKDPMDLMRVILSTNVVLDCENGEYVCGVDSMYWVKLTYGDTTLKTVYTDLNIPVKLIDLNEPPKILTDTIGVDENSPKGTVVDTIKWDDVDHFDSVMNFKIVEDPSSCFDIGKTSGIVTVKKDKCAGLDYEKNETITIRVAITDMVNVTDRSLIAGDPITITKEIKVNLRDVNEPPSIADMTIDVPETTTVWTVIDTVKAMDPDMTPKFCDLTYTVVNGDSATFKVDSKTGAVTLKDSLDYESKNEYVIYVQVSDGAFADTASVKIRVVDVEKTIEEPEIEVKPDPDPVEADSNKVPDERHDSVVDTSEHEIDADTLKHDSVADTLKHDSYELSEETFAKPSFRVRMVGLFQFVIVMDDDAPATARSYAVMDLQGRIMQKGKITSTETLVPVLNSGSYVVKVGLGMRRVNVH